MLKIAEPCYLVAGAYYVSGKVVKGVLKQRHVLITRCKSNCVARHQAPKANKPRRGRSRKVGQSVLLANLCRSTLTVSTIESPLYDDKNVMLVLQASCSSDDGVVQITQDQIGDRRLATVRTTFNSGRVDTISYQYDALGFPESHLLESDAVASEKTPYYYEINGLVDRLEQDAGVDGSVESSTKFHYEGERLTIREYDNDMDHVPDLRRTTSFDTQGRYAGFEQFTLTADGQQEDRQGLF